MSPQAEITLTIVLYRYNFLRPTLIFFIFQSW